MTSWMHCTREQVFAADLKTAEFPLMAMASATLTLKSSSTTEMEEAEETHYLGGGRSVEHDCMNYEGRSA